MFLLSNIQKSNPPGSVGTSLALETIVQHSPVDFRPIRYVLFVDFVCFSRLLLNQLCMFELFVYLDRFLSVWFFFLFCFCTRNEVSNSVLVCSKGGGGLLAERMELVNELWEENIKVLRLKDLSCKLVAQLMFCSDCLILCLSGWISPDTRSKPYRAVWICQRTWYKMSCHHNRHWCFSERFC